MRDAWLAQAGHDPRISNAVFRAYEFCSRYLDVRDERPLKVEILVRAVHCKRETAVKSLRVLVELGYIARGRRPRGEARHYRLLPAPLLPSVKARAA